MYFYILAVSVKDYCVVDSFMAKCKDNEVVMMQHARYGRMKIGRCVSTNLGHLGCKSGKIELSS